MKISHDQIGVPPHLVCGEYANSVRIERQATGDVVIDFVIYDSTAQRGQVRARVRGRLDLLNALKSQIEKALAAIEQGEGNGVNPSHVQIALIDPTGGVET